MNIILVKFFYFLFFYILINYFDLLLAIEQPPFELQETGWGEFEVLVKVYFHPSANEKAAQLYHHIRLHPYQDDPSGGPWPKDKPVTCFLYDELVSIYIYVVDGKRIYIDIETNSWKWCHICYRCLMNLQKHFIRY